MSERHLRRLIQLVLRDGKTNSPTNCEASVGTLDALESPLDALMVQGMAKHVLRPFHGQASGGPLDALLIKSVVSSDALIKSVVSLVALVKSVVRRVKKRKMEIVV